MTFGIRKFIILTLSQPVNDNPHLQFLMLLI